MNVATLNRRGKEMKCFYHTDVDGKCAGAIVKKWWDSEVRLLQDGITLEPTEYISINYNNDFPFDKIIPNEKIIIVDFSLQKEGEFEKLFRITSDVIWIDHHKTAIEKHRPLLETLNEKGAYIKGIQDITKAGCELTWEFYFPNTLMPLSVKYAGRYDVWDFTEYGEKLNEFQSGIRLQEHYPESTIWVNLLSQNDNSKRLAWEVSDKESSNIFLNNILKDGKIALKFRTNRYRSLIKAFSFIAEFEGYKAVCCNVGATSSQLFDSVKEDYDIMCPFVFDGKQWTVSIYSVKDIDCSEIAKKYGGGGHKGAAGFQCKELPFRLKDT